MIKASSAYGRSSSYDEYGFFEDYSEGAYADYAYDDPESDYNDDIGGIDDLSDPSDIEFVGDDEDIERFINRNFFRRIIFNFIWSFTFVETQDNILAWFYWDS